jgi:ABC-2 type transport system permease protein
MYRSLIIPTGAVMLRELRIYLRYRSWFIASLIWPILFPFSFILFGRGLAGPAGNHIQTFNRLAGTGDFASFMIIGNILWMFVNINLWSGGLAFQQDRERGTFETHCSLPASMLAQAFGTSLSSVLTNFIPMISAMTLFALLNILTIEAPIPRIILTFFMIIPFLLGFLLIFSSLTLKTRQSGMIVQVTRTVLSLLCGMQFPLAVLPGPVQAAGHALPLTRLVTLLRNVIIEGALLRDNREDVMYILGWGAASIAAGVIIFALVERSVRKKGVTGGY